MAGIRRATASRSATPVDRATSRSFAHRTLPCPNSAGATRCRSTDQASTSWPSHQAAHSRSLVPARGSPFRWFSDYRTRGKTCAFPSVSTRARLPRLVIQQPRPSPALEVPLRTGAVRHAGSPALAAAHAALKQAGNVVPQAVPLEVRLQERITHSHLRRVVEAALSLEDVFSPSSAWLTEVPSPGFCDSSEPAEQPTPMDAASTNEMNTAALLTHFDMTIVSRLCSLTHVWVQSI